MNNNHVHHIRLHLVLLGLLISCNIYAQRDTLDNRRDTKRSNQDGSIQLVRDTAVVDDITWHLALNSKVKGDVNDYLEDTLIFFYDPAKSPKQEYATLGNTGSPAFNLFYSNEDKIGLRINKSPYSIYDFDIDKFRFYSLKAGYTDVTYSQSGQTNSMFDGLFSRNFGGDQTNFVLKYRRINQAGYYTNQQLKNTYLSSGLHFTSFSDRLQSSFLFASNLSNHNNNGGITQFANLSGAFALERENVTVNIRSSSSNKDHRLQYAIKNSWDFFKKNKSGRKRNKASKKDNPIPDFSVLMDTLVFDNLAIGYIDTVENKELTPILDSIAHNRENISVGQSNKKLLLFHTLKFDNFSFEHKNINPSEIYQTPYFIGADSLDYNLEGSSLSNEAGIALNFGRQTTFNLSSSIEYIKHAINTAKFRDRLSDLILHNNLSFKIKDKYNFDGKLDIGLGNNSGELLAKGSISAFPGKLITGRTSITLLTQRPLYIQNNIILNDTLQQSNSLNNLKSVTWNIQVEIPKYNVSLGYNSIVLQDYIYWDTNRQVQQATNTIGIQQFTISSKIEWKFLNLISEAKFQLVSDKNQLRLPPLLLQETLYFDGAIFKKQMKYKAGAHLRLIGKYDFMTYYPTLGIFHQAKNDETRHSWIYPDATVFFEFSVNNFKMFILAENIRGYFKNSLQNGVEFELANYPQFDNRIRLGIRWIFRR